MNIVITILAAVVVGIGIFVNRSGLVNVPSNLVSETQSEALSIEEEQLEEDVVEETIETPTPKVTAPTNTPATSNSEINSYKYPNAQVVSSSGNSLELSTTDDSDTVTSWYKDKISESGMNVKSFVTTKTNDNVLNKLVGASGEVEIRVDIEKKSGESEVIITVLIL